MEFELDRARTDAKLRNCNPAVPRGATRSPEWRRIINNSATRSPCCDARHAQSCAQLMIATFVVDLRYPQPMIATFVVDLRYPQLMIATFVVTLG